MVEDEEIVEVRETHRRPNIQPFLDDLDCWLVASIEDYDLETNTAKPGPIGDRAGGGPEITSAADALAVSSTSAAASTSTTSPSFCTGLRRRRR